MFFKENSRRKHRKCPPKTDEGDPSEEYSIKPELMIRPKLLKSSKHAKVVTGEEKSKFCSKIEILVKNRNFGQKSKFCSKIEILVKNRNFGQKSKFLSKIKIVVKNRNFGKK